MPLINGVQVLFVVEMLLSKRARIRCLEIEVVDEHGTVVWASDERRIVGEETEVTRSDWETNWVVDAMRRGWSNAERLGRSRACEEPWPYSRKPLSVLPFHLV